jgi:hypothetical protein
MPEAARKALRNAGLDTPVIATGKISTPEQAEEVLLQGKGDLIGMARGLLADPDIIKKIKEGKRNTIVTCIYWNVCKALDETFHKVVCGLWPKEFEHAPYSEDTEAPKWESIEPLKVLARTNQIRLNWEQATDNEKVAGYEIWRSDNNGKSFDHIYTVGTSMYTDNLAMSGRRYQYFIYAYDLAGNKSEKSNIIHVEMPMAIEL